MLIDKLEAIEKRYAELQELISDPQIIARQPEWQEYIKEHARLEEIVEGYRQLQATRRDLKDARQMLGETLDEDEERWIRNEIDSLEERLAHAERQLRLMLVPKDPRDERDVIVEIRAGTGGNEAALFAADLFRMYSRYAERKGWKTEVLNASTTDIGGIKEIIFSVQGRGAFSRLKFESGVHRVQRVPSTESAGRIHTSTATVAVLPEAEDIDVEIEPSELQVDTFCASGPGGQHVNKTESAVRITHLPTGLVVTCQDEKSQHKNRARAMKVLRARLLDKYQSEQHEELASQRRAQVGTGDRSERIRTYNFPQNRMTDHRINLTLHRLESIMDGEIEEVIGELVAWMQAEQLQDAELSNRA